MENDEHHSEVRGGEFFVFASKSFIRNSLNFSCLREFMSIKLELPENSLHIHDTPSRHPFD